jgi:hypothetical protein
MALNDIGNILCLTSATRAGFNWWWILVGIVYIVGTLEGNISIL